MSIRLQTSTANAPVTPDNVAFRTELSKAVLKPLSLRGLLSHSIRGHGDMIDGPLMEIEAQGDPINIAHALSHTSERYGGVPIATRRMATCQAGIGMSPSLWSGGNRQDRLEIEKTALPAHIYDVTTPPSWRRCPDLADALDAASSQFDLFHPHDLWTYPQYVAPRIARKKNIPYIISPHASLERLSARLIRLDKAPSVASRIFIQRKRTPYSGISHIQLRWWGIRQGENFGFPIPDFKHFTL